MIVVLAKAGLQNERKSGVSRARRCLLQKGESCRRSDATQVRLKARARNRGLSDVVLVRSFDGGATGRAVAQALEVVDRGSPEITRSSQSRGVLVSSRWRRVSQVSREIDGDGDDVWQGGEVWLREGMRLEGVRVPAAPCPVFLGLSSVGGSVQQRPYGVLTVSIV
jgi:hypothetical protein